MSTDRALRCVAEVTGAKEVRRLERVQTLWAGYGELFRVGLEGAAARTAIVKHVRPPARVPDDEALSHARKCRSYDVETAWYRTYAPRCGDDCRVPALLGSHTEAGEWLLVLEDLDAAGFVKRTRDPSAGELDRCLAWLAALHARFLGVEPAGLWRIGTYWHVATRPEELAAMGDAALRDAAPLLDERLEGGAFRTLVHGDAKEANFCFAAHGVAAVDFQYVGGGCGARDVAYLLYGRWGTDREAPCLDAYFRHLRAALARHAPDVDADALEREWRALYPIACADFCRFLAGWAPSQWARDAQAQARARDVLAALR